MGDERTHPGAGHPAPGSKSGTSSAKRSAGTYRYPRTSRCSSRHPVGRSEEHTSELQSLMRISYAVFCLKKKKDTINCQPILKITNMKQQHTTNKQYIIY